MVLRPGSLFVSPRASPFARPLGYAITDLGSQLSDAPADRRLRLEGQLRRWVFDGVDVVQLREKRLDAVEMLRLAKAAKMLLEQVAGESGLPQPRLLVNGRADVALAAGADGIHLPSQPGELTPAQVRQLFTKVGRPACLVSVSCHTMAEVLRAREAEADLLLFGPVFEKRAGGEVVVAGLGLHALGRACTAAWPLPVLALGGVTPANAERCREAGAAGIAGIRLFDQKD